MRILALRPRALPLTRVYELVRPGVLRGVAAPAIVAATAAVVAAVWAGGLLVRRVDGLSTPAYDLAFFHQLLWNVAESGSWTSGFHEGSFLGLHLSPVLLLPAALERVTGYDVRVLSLLHGLAIGALVPVTFLFLRALLRPARLAGAVACALAVGLPVWGAMQNVVRADFRPEAFGVVLALLAGWAGLTGRARLMWPIAVGALLTREDLSYAVLVVGLVVAARGRGRLRRQGLALSVVAVAWGIVAFGLVMPWLRAGGGVDTDRYYGWLGGGGSVLVAPFVMGDRILAALTRPDPWFVVAGMVLSLAALPLLRPRWLILVGPPLVASLLSAHWPQADLWLQYPLLLVVPLLAAGGMGARRLLAILAGRRHRQRRMHRRGLTPVVTALALPALAGAWIQGSLPPFSAQDPAFASRPAAADQLRALARQVAADAPLVADEGLVAPLAGRHEIGRLTRVPFVAVDAYVLVDREAWTPGPRSAAHRNRIVDGVRIRRPIIADDGRFQLFGPWRATDTP